MACAYLDTCSARVPVQEAGLKSGAQKGRARDSEHRSLGFGRWNVLGPWLALSRSLPTFKPEVFLDIVDRMNRNMEFVMAMLTPVALLSTAPVLFFSYKEQPRTFYLTLIGFVMFALLVTMLIEVPIVKLIVTWTVGTLPANWQQLRDRWGAFHIIE